MLPIWLAKSGPKVIELLKKAGGKLGLVAKDRAEKDYFIYEKLKKIGTQPTDESFETLYNEALFRFDNENPKHILLIRLFNERSISSSFKDALSKESIEYLVQDLKATVAIKAKYSEMVAFKIDFSKEAEQLIGLYKEVVRGKRKPVEVQNNQDLLQGVEKIMRSIGQPKDSIDLSDTIANLDGLLKDKRHLGAIELLLKFQEKDWDKRSAELKYKITAKLGLAYFQIQDRKNAAKYLIQLLDFQTHLKEAYGLVALGFSLINRDQEAVQYAKLALDLDSSNANAYLALLFVHESSGKGQEDLPEIPDVLQENEGIRLNIAVRLQKKGDFTAAKKMIEEVNEKHTEKDYFKAEILHILAQVVFDSHPDMHFQIPIDDGSIVKNDLEYSRIKLIEAWNVVKDTDLRKSRWYILYHLGVIEQLLGMKLEAESHFLEVVSMHPFFQAYRQYWHLVAENKEKRERIVRDLEKLQLSKDDGLLLLLMKAEQAYGTGKAGEYVSILQVELPLIENSEIKMQYFEMLINLLLIDKNYIIAEEIAQELVKFQPTSPYGYLFLGRIATLNNDKEGANKYFSSASDLVDAGKNRVFSEEAAKGLMQVGNFQAAVEMLEKVVDKQVLNTLTRLLTSCLFHMGRDKAAFDLASDLLATYPGDLHMIEIISTIYEKEGKLEKGINFLKEEIERVVEPNYLYIKLAILYCRNGQMTEAVAIARKITDFEKEKIGIQFMIADAFVKSGFREEGFERAYRIRNEHFSEREAHTFYIQVVLSVSIPVEYHAPDTVRKDTTIELDGGGRRVTFIIVEDPKYPHEVGLNDAVSVMVMGKALNDEVIISNMKYHIRSILDKYTYAAHESMDLLPIKFGNEGPLRVGRFEPNGDPGESLRQLLLTFTPPATPEDPELDDLVTKLGTVYDHALFTLGTQAMLNRDNIINYWRRVIHDPARGVFSSGYGDGAAAAVESLKEADGIVIDIIGIMTLHVAGAIEILRMVKKEWYVSRSTWQLLENEIGRSAERPDEPSLSVDFVGENIYKIVIPVEEKKSQTERLRGLKDQLSDFVTIVDPAISDDFEKKSDLDSILGKSFNESIDVAKEGDFLLYSDDAILREVAERKFGLTCIGTLALIAFAESAELIDRDRAEEVYVRLIMVNYRNIPVNPRIMMRALKEAQYSVQFPFTNATDLIDARLLDDKMAVLLVVGFLYLLYQELSIRESRILVLQFVLGRLFAGRDINNVKISLMLYLRVKFHLLPLQLEEIRSEVILYR